MNNNRDESKRRRTYSLDVSTCIKIDKIAVLSCCDKSEIVNAAIRSICEIIIENANNNGYDYKRAVIDIIRSENNDQ